MHKGLFLSNKTSSGLHTQITLIEFQYQYVNMTYFFILLWLLILCLLSVVKVRFLVALRARTWHTNKGYLLDKPDAHYQYVTGPTFYASLTDIFYVCPCI